MNVVVEVDGHPEYRVEDAKRAKVSMVIGGVRVTLRVRPVSSRGIGNVPSNADLGMSEYTLELATPSPAGPRVQTRLQQVIPVL